MVRKNRIEREIKMSSELYVIVEKKMSSEEECEIILEVVGYFTNKEKAQKYCAKSNKNTLNEKIVNSELQRR